LVGAPAVPPAEAVPPVPHKRSGYELGAVAVVALRRVAGGARRAIAWTAGGTCLGVGTLLLVFPQVMSITLAVGAFGLAVIFGLFGLEQRRSREEAADAK
jgi:hypothetical protein